MSTAILIRALYAIQNSVDFGSEKAHETDLACTNSGKLSGILTRRHISGYAAELRTLYALGFIRPIRGGRQGVAKILCVQIISEFSRKPNPTPKFTAITTDL